MKGILLISKKILLEAQGIELTYELYSSEEELGTCYSIRILEKSSSGFDEITLDEITDSKDAATELFYLFAKEAVTPCSAPYIIDELLPI